MTLPEQTRERLDPYRFKMIFMDRKRAYFFRLLFMFYTNFAIKTTDFNLYPYISTQLVNVLASAIAKHAAD